jgi:bifunctional UDP-N-acetylglucosamine pyrophosphorylase / glucosamine-1-phosphate N-acetyltransferase
MIDPEHTYVDTAVELSADVVLYPGTHLKGHTVVATGAELGPSTQLSDCEVGSGAVVTATVGQNATIGADARVGPWAYLPSGTKVSPGSVTGACFTGGSAEDEL